MKKLLVLCGILLISPILKSQTSYTLYSLTVLQFDSIIYKGDCNDNLIINDSIIRLKQPKTSIDFYTIEEPDADGWQTVKSFASHNRPSYYHNFKLTYLDPLLKAAVKYEINGEQRVIYSVVIETAEPGATNNIRYAYLAYKND